MIQVQHAAYGNVRKCLPADLREPGLEQERVIEVVIRVVLRVPARGRNRLPVKVADPHVHFVRDWLVLGKRPVDDCGNIAHTNLLEIETVVELETGTGWR